MHPIRPQMVGQGFIGDPATEEILAGLRLLRAIDPAAFADIAMPAPLIGRLVELRNLGQLAADRAATACPHAMVIFSAPAAIRI